METRRIFGSIVIPEEDNRRIENVWLNYNKDSIFIEIPHDYHGEKYWPIILGEFIGMDEITFVRCRLGGGSSGMGGSYRKIYASYFLHDIHISDPSQLVFNKVILISPALNDWIKLPRFIEETAENTFTLPIEETVLQFNNDSYSIEISIEYPRTISGTGIHAEKSCALTIQFKEFEHATSIDQTLKLIKKLILFLTYKNPEFSKCYFFTKGGDSHLVTNTLEHLKDSRFTQQFKIYYSDIKEELINIFDKWFKEPKIHPVIDLVLQKCYNTEMSVPSYFLNICVALESFHRRYGVDNKKKLKLDNPENKKAIQQLIQETGKEELLNWFNNKSLDWEKPELRHRLKEFERTILAVFKNHLNYSIDELIGKTVKTRNDIVHEGESLKNFKSGIELFIVTKGFEFIMRLELMNYLGINIEKENNSFISRANGNLGLLVRLNEQYL